MFLFLFSTAVPRTTLQWLIPLLFLFNYIFYIRPIGHSRVTFCLYVKMSLVQNHSYDFHLQVHNLTHFLMQGLAQRLVLKQRQKETFIHELLTRAFDFFPQKRKISFLSGNSPYLATKERMRGEGVGGALKVPGLIWNFPHIVTFPKSIREHLGVSIVWSLDLTFLG